MKLLPILKEIKEDLPKILWHATDYENLVSIMHEGLKPDKLENAVFFTDTPSGSAKFLLIRGVKHIISIPVETRKLDKSKIQESFDHNENFFQTRAWMYLEHIPASKINTNKIMVYDLRK
jgi:RNA:NAD 2'-phosphotransferase (TPT1/KptA family)